MVNITWLEILKAIFAVSGMIAILYSAHTYIDNRINKAINAAEYIDKVASALRPSIIYDLNTGSIINDSGGMQYIKEIIVEEQDRNRKKIILTPKYFMESAPLLYTIDPLGFNVNIKRGRNIDWEYEMSQLISFGGNQFTRFRIEIISKK